MNRTGLPETAFVDPRGGNRERIEELAAKVAKLVISLSSEACSRPPLPKPTAAVSAQTGLRDAPTAEDELLEELRGLLTSSTNAAHPGYVGHMDSMPTTASVLGELASAAVNNMLSVEMSPASATPSHCSLSHSLSSIAS